MNDNYEKMLYKKQIGEWRLIAPDGTIFVGESPLECVKAELNYRVPQHVQLERIIDFINETDDDA